MNKNLIAIIGMILVAIIGYQAYLLGKKDAQIKEKAPEPKITVSIDKNIIPRKKQTKAVTSQTTSHVTPQQEPLIDEKKLKSDLNKLFNDIFGNPKVKKEIQKNISQMQEQLQSGMQDFQKEMLQMTQELQKASQNDDFLKGLFKNFNLPKMQQFSDKGDHYYLQTAVPGNAKSAVDVQVKRGFIRILINHVYHEDRQENGIVIKKEVHNKQQVFIAIPKDADVQNLKTNYKDGLLEISIPKLKA